MSRYREIEMPEVFVLECLTSAGEWIDWGRYAARAFTREEDGTYIAQGAGSRLLLRCLRQDGCLIYVVDGAGDPHTYRLVAFPGGGYS